MTFLGVVVLQDLSINRLLAQVKWDGAGYNNQPKSATEIREANPVSSLIESQIQE